MVHYAEPKYIILAFIVCGILSIFFLLVLRRRRKLLNRFVEKGLADSIAPAAGAGRKIFRMLIFTAAIFLLVYSMARPQWGFEWKETKLKGLDILIAIDVSKSMLATDVKPNRLKRTELGVKDLVKRLNGDRIGLIAFSGTAFLQCPMTIDYNGFLLTLDDLNVNTIPRGGTSISGAIREAIKIFGPQEKKYKVLIIITDGDDLEGDPLKAAKEAAESGIKIYCVGVGTSEGSLIPATSENGERGWVADKRGNVVKSKLNEDMLKNIAISTGGSYIRATQSDFGLIRLYDDSISKSEKKDVESKMNKRYHERFQYFLGIAILLLLFEPLIFDKKRLLK